ncbi:hypothetical protein sscle_11g081690 [Sclerotinia sclerotiorum 1980 UF-70]|uniref:Uncharacterized protein n=1 Tax=Sclerotinia sclerotiorum (strain ATCC 18683 / 1980 / Ss-1) TaxID=665079 RepID=A0A1D9QET6_SCLS1|nr:hypothetical protein sscle_11g081690 [Sclerotinia sclerotiorum 1980 UF-70]
MPFNPTNIPDRLLTICEILKLLIKTVQFKFPKRNMEFYASYVGRKVFPLVPKFNKVEDLMITISLLVDNGLEEKLVPKILNSCLCESLQSSSTVYDVEKFYNEYYKNSRKTPLIVYQGIWMRTEDYEKALGSLSPRSLTSLIPRSLPLSSPTIPLPAIPSLIPRSRPLSSPTIPSSAIPSLIPRSRPLSSPTIPSPTIPSLKPRLRSLLSRPPTLRPPTSRPLSSPTIPSSLMISRRIQLYPLPSCAIPSHAIPSTLTLPAPPPPSLASPSPAPQSLASSSQPYYTPAPQSLASPPPTPQSLASPPPTPQSLASPPPTPQSLASSSQPYYKPTHYTSISVPLTNDSNNSEGFLEWYQVFFENKYLVPSDYTKYPGLNEDYHEASGLNFIYDTSMNNCNSNLFYRSRSRLMVVLPSEIQTLIGIFPLVEGSNEPITLDRLAFLTVCYQKQSSLERLKQSEEADLLGNIIKATTESFYKQHGIFEDSVASSESLFLWISTFFLREITILQQTIDGVHNTCVKGRLIGIWIGQDGKIFLDIRGDCGPYLRWLSVYEHNISWSLKGAS